MNTPGSALRLEIELVPSSAWAMNVRTLVPKHVWAWLGTRQSKAAGDHCEVCGAAPRSRRLDCHELWRYNDVTHTQTLTGLIALCLDCHSVKHIGFAGVQGRHEQAFAHFKKVNALTTEAARAHLREAQRLFDKRSRYEWTLDITWLESVLPERIPK